VFETLHLEKSIRLRRRWRRVRGEEQERADEGGLLADIGAGDDLARVVEAADRVV
jgi:hypothetical protein